MSLVGVSSAPKCAFEVDPEVALRQWRLGKAALHPELLFVFPFELRGGSGAFGGENTVS